MTVKRPIIAYITPLDARNKHSWSGTNYFIWSALQKNVGEVTLIGPIKPFLALWIGKIATGLSQKIFHKRYNYRHSWILAKAYAKVVNKQLSKNKFDLIVVPATSTFIPYLETNVPIAYVGDSTVISSMNYHKALTNLFPFSARETIMIEGLAFDKANFLVFSSEWAANSAINDFRINSNKVFVAPFGPNMEPSSLPSREITLTKQKSNICRLFFIGVNWVDKGGSIAFQTMIELNNMGIETQLTVCGCVPPDEFKHPKLIIIPFLDKNNEDQKRKLTDVYLHSDFLILPTRFESFGVVFSEASAFGIPSIATDTGGVPSAVIEGKNGFLLPLSATGKDYARVIAGIFTDENKYLSLAEDSRDTFEIRSNWDNWAKIFNKAYQKSQPQLK